MLVRKLVTGLALGATLLVSASGCSITGNIATLKQYAPSDGFSLNYGNVKFRNFIYVVAENERHLIGSVINSGLEAQTLKLQYTDAATGEKINYELNVPAEKKLDFGYNESDSLDFNLPGMAGGTTTFFVLQNDTPAKRFVVPVLDGTLPEYQNVVDNLGK
jgi:hypothetical protein